MSGRFGRVEEGRKEGGQKEGGGGCQQVSEAGKNKVKQ